jgi:AraC-like DNA-binding protein
VTDVVALVVERTARARVSEALRDRGEVDFYDRTTDVWDAVVDGRARVVLLEPVDVTGRFTAPLVSSLRTGFPSVPIVAYCDPRIATSAQILELARAGVNELVMRGVDDVRLALTAAMDGAERHCAAECVLARLGSRLPKTIAPIIRFFLHNAGQPVSVADAAAALGVHRKTLFVRLAAAGYPPPSVLASWCRLLVASKLLEDPARPVTRVALELDFASATALRNMLRRYTGLTPVEVRARGGFEHLYHLFMSAERPPGHRARRHPMTQSRVHL